jgi:hypothetical protein
MTLDRRRFLQIAAAGTVASITSSACAPDTADDANPLTHPALVEMLGAERVREIGRQYRVAVPAENTAAALRAVISSSRHQTFPRIGRRSIEDAIRDDFSAGRTVVVSGWVLSETEARQCALYSLAV